MSSSANSVVAETIGADRFQREIQIDAQLAARDSQSDAVMPLLELDSMLQSAPEIYWFQ
jgi:hypothetical protein